MTLDLWVGVLDVVVYYFISETFAGATTESLGAAPSYFAFALVGIAVTVVIQAASLGIATKVREEQLTGTLEALVAQPVTTTELATGLCGLPFAISAVRVAVYLIFGALAFGLDLSHTDWVGFFVMLGTTALSMSAVGIGTAAVVLVVKRGATIAGLVIFAMSLVGGAFFPVEVLPDWLEAIGQVVPPRFAFDGFRISYVRRSRVERRRSDARAVHGRCTPAVGLAVRPRDALRAPRGHACPVLTGFAQAV